MTRRRDPVRLAEALEELTRGAQPPSALAEIQRRWAEVVGETIAGWARPVAERAGVLTVECDDSVIAHELKMMAPQLLEKLAAALPSGAPRELRFRVG
ncbi:MAG: DUF721 domain-containing protein [Actinobacteria bacterium]|nr:DUF721 domain-containing protein [Actinomycetota bacterium]